MDNNNYTVRLILQTSQQVSDCADKPLIHNGHGVYSVHFAERDIALEFCEFTRKGMSLRKELFDTFKLRRPA